MVVGEGVSAQKETVEIHIPSTFFEFVAGLAWLHGRGCGAVGVPSLPILRSAWPAGLNIGRLGTCFGAVGVLSLAISGQGPETL